MIVPNFFSLFFIKFLPQHRLLSESQYNNTDN
jgi:hypothetical protein